MATYQGLRYALSRRLQAVAASGVAKLLERLMLPTDLVVALARILTDPRVPRHERQRILAMILNPSLPSYLKRHLPRELSAIDSRLKRLLVTLDLAFNQVDPCLVRELWPGDGDSLDSLQRNLKGALRWQELGFREGIREFLLKRGLLRGLLGSRPEEPFPER